METKQWFTINRADWPAGPWDGEPDKMQWRDEATGLPCLIVRGPVFSLCGYVGVPPSHPLHGSDYYDSWHDTPVNEIRVHGGLTFAGGCQPGDESKGICHVPEPDEPDDIWWFGFDCAHSGDYSPFDIIQGRRGYPFGRTEGTVYRTVAYVQQQCRELAAQLAANTHG